MFCPKCSQQQASEEMRFCSRCGFRLGVVRELIAQNETPVSAEAEALAPSHTLRKRDVIIGAMLMFVISLIVVIAASPIPPVRNLQLFMLVVLFIALTLFVNFINPLMRAAGKLFAENDTKAREGLVSSPYVNSGLVTQVSRSALPPPHSVPAVEFSSPRANTAEVVQPPSITERTTSLLQND